MNQNTSGACCHRVAGKRHSYHCYGCWLYCQRCFFSNRVNAAAVRDRVRDVDRVWHRRNIGSRNFSVSGKAFRPSGALHHADCNRYRGFKIISKELK